MVEAHYAVPALNAVLNTLNTRLDARAARLADEPLRGAVLITDREFAPTIGQALRILRDEHGRTPIVIDVCDSEYARPRRAARRARVRGAARRARAAAARSTGPADEWDAIAVSLHLGHDRRPEGRRHASPRRLPQRGVQRGDLDHAALPALPVDACRCSTATAGASRGRWRCSAARTSACARSRRAAILDAMREHGVDHYCAAPIVHNLLIAAPAEHARRHHAEGARHGRRRRAAGVDDRGHGADRLRDHARLRPDRGLRAGGGVRQAAGVGATRSLSEQTRLNGRQGVRYVLQEGMTVLDPETMREVPADGADDGRDHVPRQHRR